MKLTATLLSILLSSTLAFASPKAPRERVMAKAEMYLALKESGKRDQVMLQRYLDSIAQAERISSTERLTSFIKNGLDMAVKSGLEIGAGDTAALANKLASSVKIENGKASKSDMEVVSQLMNRVISLAKTKQMGDATSALLKTINENLGIVSAVAKTSKKLSSTDITDITKIISMDSYNSSASDFKLKFAQELLNNSNKSIAEMIRDASGGKITLEDVRKCVL